MEACEFFNSANAAFVNEDYEEAHRHYSCAIELDALPHYFANRSFCRIKLGHFAAALEDANMALQQDRELRRAQICKGQALFYTGEWEAAKNSFLKAKKLRDDEAINSWILKCDGMTKGAAKLVGRAQPRDEAKSSPSGPPAGSAPKPAAVPAAPARPVATQAPISTTKAPEVAKDRSISGRNPVKMDWFQNNEDVCVTVFIKNLVKEGKDKLAQITFEPKNLSVTAPLPGGATDEEYQLDLNLNKEIDPAASSFTISNFKIEIKLKKKAVGAQWKVLEEVEADAAMDAPPSYPTSNRQKKNWSDVDKECEADLSEDKPEGEQALNKLFRDIYGNADDDTRRAMVKSFQTSGGTVLSTNWKDVSQADYEGKDRPDAPEGQQWADERK